MPVFGATSSINTNIQPPITFTMVIPYDNIQQAQNLIGQTIQSQQIAGARWGLYFYVCPTNQPYCKTPQQALSVVFRVQQDGFYLEFDAGPYYISNPPILSFKYPVQNLTSDAQISITFDGSNITVSGNGTQILTVDMLKTFSAITQLSSGCWFFTPDLQQINNVDTNYLSFLVDTSTPANFSALLDSILPLIIIVPIIALLPKIIPVIAPKVSSAVNKVKSKIKPSQNTEQ